MIFHLSRCVLILFGPFLRFRVGNLSLAVSRWTWGGVASLRMNANASATTPPRRQQNLRMMYPRRAREGRDRDPGRDLAPSTHCRGLLVAQRNYVRPNGEALFRRLTPRYTCFPREPRCQAPGAVPRRPALQWTAARALRSVYPRSSGGREEGDLEAVVLEGVEWGCPPGAGVPMVVV